MKSGFQCVRLIARGRSTRLLKHGAAVLAGGGRVLKHGAAVLAGGGRVLKHGAAAPAGPGMYAARTSLHIVQ
jgi:hypothetical protein